MMINAKKLINIARKSQKMATVGWKSIALPGASGDYNTNPTKKVEKGHFVVYTLDGNRFVFPLEHLKTYIFRELLTMSEEEYGLPSNGPITFPCDASFMNHAANLIRQHATLDTERDLLLSLATKSCSLPFLVHQEETSGRLVAHAC